MSAAWWIVVLTWNGREDTLACLRSIAEITTGDVGTVVVDNGSTDGTVAAVRAARPGVTIIENHANLGYAAGNNAGIRHALAHGADWVVLLNNDATVAPDVVDAFAAGAQAHPRAGILGGIVLDAERRDRIQFAGQGFNRGLGYSGRPRGAGRSYTARYRPTVATERAVGALMAVSAPALRRVGPFDEDLFAYVEDVDLSLRVRDAGYEVLVVGTARAWHRLSAATGGAASSAPSYYGARNTIAVCERRAPRGRMATRVRRVTVLATFLAHALLVRRSAAAARAVLAGYRDAAARRLGPRPASARS